MAKKKRHNTGSAVVRLYHMTSLYHWPSIECSGVIRRTESNVSPERETPDAVVWLSKSQQHRQSWQQGSLVDKSAVQIILDIPERWAVEWKYYARRQRVPAWWVARLAEVGGGDDGWVVCEHEIPREFWVKVWHTGTGQVLYEREHGEDD